MDTINFNNLSIEHVVVFNEIREEIESDYINIIETIFNKTDKSIEWCLNSIISRSPVLSDLLYNLCCLGTIKKIFETSSDIKKINVKSLGLKKVIDNAKLKVDVYVVKQPFANKFNPFLEFIKNIKYCQYNLLASNRKRIKDISVDNKIIILDTFLLKNSITSKKYIERYYTEILNYISQEQKKNIYFLPELLFPVKKSVLEEIYNNSECNLIFKNDFLHFSDYLFALVYPFRIKKIKFDNINFKGFNIEPILKEDFNKYLINKSTLIGLLNYRFVKRIKQKGIDIKHFIDWSENQPIDKGLIKGLKEHFLDSKISGYQGFIVSPNYVNNIIPLIFEKENDLLPNKIFVVGKGLIDRIKIHDKSFPVFVAPAFRFNEIWNILPLEIEPNNLLISLPIGITECKEIINIILKIFNEIKKLGLKIIIKPHPAVDIKKIAPDLFSGKYKEIEISKNNFSEEIVKAKVLLSNSSSTCVESLAVGVPVIIIGSQSGITQNPIPENISHDFWRLCYTESDVINTVRYFINFNFSDKIGFMNFIRNNYFEKVTKEGIEDFLLLN